MDDLNIPKNPASMWLPMTDPYEVGVLTKLGEEAGELCSVVSRCLAQGIDESHPVTGKPNQQWLEDEIADLYSKFDEAIAGLGLNQERIEKRRKAKFDFHQSWFDWLRSLSPKHRKG